MAPKKTLDLEILLPDRIVTTSAGDLTIKPFKWGQLKQVLATVGKYKQIFAAQPDSDNAEMFERIMSSGPDALDDLAQMAIYCTDKDTAFFDTLGADEMIEVLFAVFEVNASFFVQKFRSGSELVQNSVAAASGDGEPSSSASLTTVTP